MSRFLRYSPDQAYLPPPSVKEELGEDHFWPLGSAAQKTFFRTFFTRASRSEMLSQ